MGPGLIRRGTLLLLLALAACPGSSSLVGDAGSPSTITISGRVVDFQSCFTQAGCQGVPDVQVVAFYDSTRASDITFADGAFVLPHITRGGVYYLLATDAGGGGEYLSTLQATPVIAEGGDVFGIEVYAVRAQSALYRSTETELGAKLGSDGIYFGQVLKREDNALVAYQNAGVTVAPAATTRFIKTNLDLDPEAPPGQEAFYAADWLSTGPLGQFVVVAAAERAQYVIMPTSAEHSFDPAYVPLGKGYVTVGLHYTR